MATSITLKARKGHGLSQIVLSMTVHSSPKKIFRYFFSTNILLQFFSVELKCVSSVVHVFFPLTREL